MSYSRFFDSDLYLYPHVSGYICCAMCSLNKGNSIEIYDDNFLRSHLEEHALSGDTFPNDLYTSILNDKNRYGKLN